MFSVLFPSIKRIPAVCFLLFCFMTIPSYRAQKADSLIQSGWQALVRDQDSSAIAAFEKAYRLSVKEHDDYHSGEALLHLGMSFYGVSASRGLEYAQKAIEYYKASWPHDSLKALKGIRRCEQLMSTVYARQGHYLKSIALSREAIQGFEAGDKTGQRGIIYTSIGSCYEKTGATDSAAVYFLKALAEHRLSQSYAYLPLALANVARMQYKRGISPSDNRLLVAALRLADSTENQQALAGCLLAECQRQSLLGQADSAFYFCHKAIEVAQRLRDRSFVVNATSQLVNLFEAQQNYKGALKANQKLDSLRSEVSAYDHQHILKNLEVQYRVAEKDRELELMEKEKNMTQLSNYLLILAIVSIICIASLIFYFMRKNQIRKQQLLDTQEQLVVTLASEKQLREAFLQNELEHKESLLSSLALQMLEKNELIQEISEKLADKDDQSMKQTLQKGLNRNKDWKDFDTYFESLNKNFYLRLKEISPDISPNDLKICALIKLNLSIKEMAVILSISPDSVKTARYRLRKKLSLQTEDNLTDFILSL